MVDEQTSQLSLSDDVRQFEDRESAISATAKALAYPGSLELHYATTPRLTIRGQRNLHLLLPFVAADLSLEQLTQRRGYSDSIALYVAHHDPLCHQRLMPQGAVRAYLFNRCEQLRIQIFGSRLRRGIAYNLEYIWDKRDDVLDGFLQHTPLWPMVGRSVQERARWAFEEGVIDALRNYLRGLDVSAGGSVTEEIIAQFPHFSDSLGDQEAFAYHTLALLHFLYSSQDNNISGRELLRQLPTIGQKRRESLRTYHYALTPVEAGDEGGGEGEGEGEGLFADIGAEERKFSINTSIAGTHLSESLSSGKAGPLKEMYKVFSRQFDLVAPAERLVSTEELKRLYILLEGQLKEFVPDIQRLTHRLQRRLMARYRLGWEVLREHGLLDPKRLSQIIVPEGDRRVFKEENEQVLRDTIVTLLIDNSGSMRGRPIMMAALCVGILGQTFERCGIGSEILGFTTRHWRGGKSRELWQEQGRPARPGRLNDLCHIIYKNAAVSWRHARYNIALMLKEGLLKENIDGEALEWAYHRLLKRPEKRKLLIVISDGAPVDDATLAFNRADYLDVHLQTMISQIETQKRVHLIGVGIGHNVAPYYKHTLFARQIGELGHVLTENLVDLLLDPAV